MHQGVQANRRRRSSRSVSLAMGAMEPPLSSQSAPSGGGTSPLVQ
eukprot:CAMPEP_0119427534 /NCGR_PEP_ID=MMETSP1335-20130426/38560_1 /TAXON_ID=259385 /ORGANISM="Chrysoculter rhomboideus, Strain RCC1486" /LENGTH=44 /DNA_ID= /DNA_START= /DNA_END= /DNA_ORIENTATION=